MLVAAAGNTALQSVMPAIGREIGIADFWVAIAYTWSAVLWVRSRLIGRARATVMAASALILLGLGGFIVSMLLCGLILAAGLNGMVGGVADLRPVRHLPRHLRLARLRHAERDPGLSRLAHPPRGARHGACRRLASSFGLGTIIGPALAPLFVLPVRRPARTAVRLRR